MADKKGITPLPWIHSRESVSDLGGWKPSEIFSFADEQNPKIIATLAARNSMDENAEYIVRACNAFPQMLEALDELTLLIAELREVAGGSATAAYIVSHPSYAKALDSIAAAKGEGQ